MISLFRSDPLKKLKKDYATLLEKAMQAQRGGDIKLYSELSVEADSIYQKITELENKST